MDVRSVLDELFLLAQDVDTSGKTNSGRVAAAIVHRNQVIAWGTNEHKTHPFQAKFAKNHNAIFWHAETRAIFNALRRTDEETVAASTLYVCRARYADDRASDWQWGLARPCRGCQQAIKRYHIPRIIHSLDGTGVWDQILFD